MLHTSVLILGGGITGLSTAYHLEKTGFTDYLLAEKQPVFGGLCASRRVNGFTLDYGGHLLHLRTAQGEAIVRELLGDNLVPHKRSAWVFFEGKRIPFPFQANLWALPENIRQECVAGLLELAEHVQAPLFPETDFETWCLSHFGSGIYKHFMRPYNEKLWGCALKDLTSEWCAPFVPVPDAAKIHRFAQHPPKQDFGYNASFYYPKTGGIGALTNALAQNVTHKRTSCPAEKIDLSHRRAELNGEMISYDTLVNTLPLPDFMRLVTDAPEMQFPAQALRPRAVSVLHVSVARETEKFGWIYFADKKFPFHRVGLQSGFSPDNAPAGTSLFYVEFGGAIFPSADTDAQIKQALCEAGILSPQDNILLWDLQVLPRAYAVYDKNRAPATTQLLSFLEKNRCFCAGRYGRWEYTFMEHNLTEGARLAQKLI